MEKLNYDKMISGSEEWFQKEGQYLFPGLGDELNKFNERQVVEEELKFLIPILLY